MLLLLIVGAAHFFTGSRWYWLAVGGLALEGTALEAEEWKILLIILNEIARAMT